MSADRTDALAAALRETFGDRPPAWSVDPALSPESQARADRAFAVSAASILAALQANGWTVEPVGSAYLQEPENLSTSPAPPVERIDPTGLSAAEIDTLSRALKIGSISHDGDGWFAADAGFGYDEAEAVLDSAHKIVARLAAGSEGEAET